MEKAEWYVDWFNSPYYHLLYDNRNYHEANFFVDNLCSALHLKPEAKIWDLACGKGRHAIALNKKGLNVTGTDLSSKSIEEASRHENDSLKFMVHDMRDPFRTNYFDGVFNLFTSFGYFKDQNDNFRVFENVANALVPEGEFLLDFFNAEKVVTCFKSAYTERRGDIIFDIKKTIKDRAIFKRIEFSDQGHNYYFEESVSLLTKKDFLQFAKAADLELTQTYGNYTLEPFDEKTSDRLILIFKK